MSAPQQQDIDRLAEALARLLADWWLRHRAEEEATLSPVADDETVLAATATVSEVEGL